MAPLTQTTILILTRGHRLLHSPTIDDYVGDEAEAETLAYLRGVCSHCRANVAAYCVLCGLRDYCGECDADQWLLK